MANHTESHLSHARGLTGNGKCNNGCCKQGKISEKGRFKHTVVIAGENERRLKGTKVKQQLWSLPKLLTTEILAACVNNRDNACQSRLQQLLTDRQTDRQKTDRQQTDGQSPSDRPMYVIDLFSGGESWRTTVEGMGLVYVPVDISPLVGDEA